MKFTDKNNNLVQITITYDENISICGSINNSFGQIHKDVVPKTDEQKEFLDLWEKYHLKTDYPKEKIEELSETITSHFMEDVISGEQTDEELTTLLAQLNLDLPDSIYIACIKEFDLSIEDLEAIEKCSYGENEYEVQGSDYLIGSDEEMDDEWDKYLDDYIDDCVLHELPENLRKYFDSESFKDDCRYDGRAHSLASYDGEELSQETPDGTIYMYRR